MTRWHLYMRKGHGGPIYIAVDPNTTTMPYLELVYVEMDAIWQVKGELFRGKLSSHFLRHGCSLIAEYIDLEEMYPVLHRLLEEAGTVK